MLNKRSQRLVNGHASSKRRFRRWILGLIVFVLVLLSGLLITTIEVATNQSMGSPECSEPLPFVRPTYPGQAAFTARTLFVGSKYGFRSGHNLGKWAVAYVGHRYWGLPWWSSGLVVLSPGIFEQGIDYFVDGHRAYRFLPIVYIGPCNRTRPLSEAVVDLKVLSEGPPKSGVRIINRAYRQATNGPAEPASGLTVQIKGPSGTTVTKTDANGIYDVSGLPPGRYTIQIENPNRRDKYEAYDAERSANLKAGDVWGRPVYSE